MSRSVARQVLLACAATALAWSAFGCSGSSASAGDAAPACTPVTPPTTCPSPPPSYASEISFIVASDCAACHAPGGVDAKHDFTTYEGIVGDRLTFAQQVSLCPTSSSGMPPLGYPQPTTEQRTDLIAWATVCGAPNN
jgi:hypothetical protein